MSSIVTVPGPVLFATVSPASGAVPHACPSQFTGSVFVRKLKEQTVRQRKERDPSGEECRQNCVQVIASIPVGLD